MLELADLIGSIAPGYKKEFFGEVDTRSYRVNFDKIIKILGFKVDYTPQKGAEEIYEALESGKLVPNDRQYTIKWWEQLSKKENLWRTP